MIKKSKSKAAIIGAGYVGASIAFTLALEQALSEFVLIDANKEKAVGEALDINHGLAFLGQMNIYAGDYQDVKDCDVIVVAAGINRKPGESRLDLAQKNATIAKDIIDNIMKYYNGGVILVVANPVDVLTYLLGRWSGLPHGRVIGTGTILDSSRFRHAISKRLNIDVRNVHGYIIGEHGESQVPAWSATHVAGMHIDKFSEAGHIRFGGADKLEIASEVRTAGAVIIKHKGATYYAIAVGVSTLVESLVKSQNTIRTVSSEIRGLYGVENVALSLPAIINGDGVYDYIELELPPAELEGFRASARAIREIIDGLDVSV